jgi:Peptidoglycan-binding protein, CsiV
MNTVHRLLTVLLAAACATAGAADLPPLQNAWYRVEILIFERNGDIAVGNPPELLLLHGPRQFPLSTGALDDDARGRAAAYPLDAATLAEPAFPSVGASRAGDATRLHSAGTANPSATAAPGSPERAGAVLAAYETQLRDESFRWLPSSTFLMKQEDGRLQRDGGYAVVLHGAWIQPVPDRERPLPSLIQTGDRLGDAWRIEGTIEVTLGRYLHVDTRLWYRPDPGAFSGEPPAQSGTTAIAVDPSPVRDSSDGYMELREQRRMRSSEVHYFDHPKFGMLVRVDPVLLPNELLAELTSILGEPIAQPILEPGDDKEAVPTSEPGPER